MSGPTDKSVPLDDAQRRQIYHIYQHEATVRACVNRILATLFSAGIHLRDDTQNLKNDFKKHLDEKWVPFASETCLNFILYGYSAYIINKERDPETRRIIKYPTSVPMDHIQIRVEVNENYEKEYKVFKRQYGFRPVPIEEPDKRVKLAFYENCSRPGHNGELHSDMAVLVQEIQNVDEFMEYALRSESYTSHPTLFIQSTPDTRRFEEVSHLRAFDDEFVEETQTQEQYKKTYDRYNNLENSADNVMSHSKPVYSNRTGRMLPSHEKVWRNNIFAVPEGNVLANNVPLPQTKADLINLMKAKEEKICAVIGVPRSILMNDQAHSSSGLSDLASRTFRRTVDSYKVAILSVLNEIFRTIYGEAEDLLNIPGMPLVTVEGAVALYERGVFGADVMAKYLMNGINASQNDIDFGRVKLLDEHFLRMIQLQREQAEVNIKATQQTATQHDAAESGVTSGQGISKRMRIERERAPEVASGNAD